jgi:hypothetical protein
MTDDTLLPFSFPAIRGKKITAAFDGGRITSDGGVMLLAAAERRLGLADGHPIRPANAGHQLKVRFRCEGGMIELRNSPIRRFATASQFRHC